MTPVITSPKSTSREPRLRLEYIKASIKAHHPMANFNKNEIYLIYNKNNFFFKKKKILIFLTNPPDTYTAMTLV